MNMNIAPQILLHPISNNLNLVEFIHFWEYGAGQGALILGSKLMPVRHSS